MAIINGTPGNDVLVGNIPTGFGPGDEIYGFGGDDSLIGQNASDKLYGGDGRDRLFGGGGNDLLDGGRDDDWLYGGDGDDILQPGSGNDYVDGGNGIDTVDYSTAGISRGVTVDLRITTAQNTRGAGFDTIVNVENVTGSAFSDTINGNAGNNLLIGGAGSDKLYGNDGHDRLSDGTGNDYLYGGTGNDWFVVDMTSAGRDLFSGGDGIDGLNFGQSAIGVQVNLALSSQNFGSGSLDTISSIEQIQGSRFDDVLNGNAADNWISGGAGSDSIYGADGNDSLFAGPGDIGTGNFIDGGTGNDLIRDGSGNDNLFGGAGDDRIQSSGGADSVSGGAGADLIAFGFSDIGAATAIDTLTDFESADTIYLQSFGFVGPVTLIGDAAFSGSGHTEIRLTTLAYGQLLEVDLEGNGPADVDYSLLIIGDQVVWNNDPTLSDFQFGNILPF